MFRGEVYWCTLNSEGIGSEQKGTRPVLIVQNDIGNRYSPTTIICVLTKRQNNKKQIPTHVDIMLEDFSKPDCAKENKFIDSIFMAEQIITVDKQRIKGKIGQLKEKKMKDIDKALLISLGVNV